MRTHRGRYVWAGVVFLVTSFGGRVAGQSQPPAGRALTTSGVPLRGEELFALDLGGTSVGEVPAALKLLSGNVEVVLRGGVRMLKAPTASSFLITLPQVLPQDFNLEFDLIPKVGGPPPDLTVEGTPTINQGPGSAHLLWQADGYLAVIGGAQENYEQPMPEDLRATMPGVLTHVGLSFEGNTVKLYTNGRRLFTLERQFARGRVLRVSLGGADGGEGAVYLAALRIATGAQVIAAGPAPRPATTKLEPPAPGTGERVGPGPPGATEQRQSGLTGSETAQQKSGLTGETATMPAVTGITPRVGAQGDASVSWAALQDATSYFVVRWKVDDPACCSNFSPPAGIPALTWQDGVLPRSGTYGYRVYATSSAGIAVGETRVTYQRIASVSEQPAEPAPAPATPPPAAGPGTKQTVTKDPHPSPAGVVALFAPEQFGYGIMLMWSPIPSATAFRVYRMASASEPGQLLATVTKADADKLSSMGGAVQGAYDPTGSDAVGGGGKYWVEAVFADGAISPPSLLAEIKTQFSNPFAGMVPPVENLTATVSGTTTLALVSNRTTMNGQQGRASYVTWNWDVPPGTAGMRAIFYFVTAQLYSGGFGSPTLYHSETIRISTPLPFAVMLSGGVLGPPFKLPVPAGMGVRFCVSYVPIEKQVGTGNYGSSTVLSPNPTGCVDSTIPP